MIDPSSDTIHLQVDVGGQRLDRFVAGRLETLSRARVQRLIRDGLVLVDGQPAKPSLSVEAGMSITVYLEPETPLVVSPQPLDLDVVWEDEALLVVNKPAGLVVHPAAGHWQDTLVNALLARYPDLNAGDWQRPGIVHRLDRDTSGLLLVAKTETALADLRRQFKTREVRKTYLALVHGRPTSPQGIIDAPIGRDSANRKRMAVVGAGRAARTSYRLVEDLGTYSLLEVGLETGRTHQIRVHLSWLGLPVVADRVYGRRKDKLNLGRQFLHAWRLSFRHPLSGEQLELEAPLPEDLRRVLLQLGSRLPQGGQVGSLPRE